MIPCFFSRATKIKLTLFSTCAAAGLLVSLSTGCTSTPQPIVADKTQPQVSAPAASAPVNAQETSTNPASQQESSTYQHALERIAQLKEAQLQAQASKIAYSDHTEPCTAPPVPPAPATPQIDHIDSRQYTVEAGENLYAIAAKANVYQDGLLWPLIYKSNRDQIKDPEQIYPGQQLTISYKHNEQEKEAARETARKSGIFIH
ncbi:MAG: LysM peptidoglycan-binding domain-containing protein [Desulfuromonas sp.]|nr:LysM peptidoglycan-binding domain-containing protein [Desulfuromonas sp.]